MLKKSLLVAVLIGVLFSLMGCETLKGSVQGAGEGAKKDWENAQKVDAWLRDQLCKPSFLTTEF